MLIRERKMIFVWRKKRSIETGTMHAKRRSISMDNGNVQGLMSNN